MENVVGWLRRVLLAMWGQEPTRRSVWNDRAERDAFDERARWFVMR